jgi:23S rRNA (uracil1939-C5)-methyltransferase
VVNPPRSGLSAEAASALATTDAARIAYISCDPSTLARDMARLASAWRPRVARPFDVFPQTGHVETVLWLDRRASTDL